MADDLTQAEADSLLRMEKHCVDDVRVWAFPGPGGSTVIPLTDPGKVEEFILDVQRSQIRVTKATYQNRHQNTTILARLDLDGPPHRNPDGQVIPCPHLHVFREGFGVKWAVSAQSQFTNTADLAQTIREFMTYINVTRPPTFQASLI